MNCTNCGAQLTGVENVCPNCGTPVVKEEVLTPAAETPAVAPAPVVETPVMEPVAPAPVVEPTPAVAPAPVVETPVMEQTPVAPTPVVEPAPVVETPVMEPVAPVVEPTPAVAPAPTGFVEPAVAAQQPTMTAAQPAQAEAPKKDNKTIILIIALVAVAVIAVVVYFLVLAPANTPASPAPTTNNGGTETPVSTATKESYAGYTFTLPEGYKAQTSDEYGLMIGNSERVMSVAVDYSHNYEAYKTALSAKYPDQKDKLINTISGREYLILVYTDETGAKGSQYVTKADDNTTFIGMMVRSDYTQATTEDFSVATEVLDSATKGTSSFAAGDDLDAGKSGEKIYTFAKDKFSFEEKGE